jgi:hypothetical protein
MGCLDEAKRIGLTNKAPVVRHAAPVSRPDSAVLAPLGVSGLRAPQRSQMRPTRTLNSPKYPDKGTPTGGNRLRTGIRQRQRGGREPHPSWATWNTWDLLSTGSSRKSVWGMQTMTHDGCCVAGVGPVVWLVHSTFSSSSVVFGPSRPRHLVKIPNIRPGKSV